MKEELLLESLETEDLPLNREFKIRVSLTGREKRYQFINSFYDRYFFLIRIEMTPGARPSGDVVALLNFQEVWAEYTDGSWARSLELHNSSKQSVSFALVIRILDYP